MIEVIVHEGRNKVVAVIVARMSAQHQRLTDLVTRGFKGFGVQLGRQEFVGQTLIDQDASRVRRRIFERISRLLSWKAQVDSSGPR